MLSPRQVQLKLPFPDFVLVVFCFLFLKILKILFCFVFWKGKKLYVMALVILYSVGHGLLKTLNDTSWDLKLCTFEGKDAPYYVSLPLVLSTGK